MTENKLTFEQLPRWHREMLSRLLAAKFPGQNEIAQQIANGAFRIVDSSATLEIEAKSSSTAPVEKTIPVEAYAYDIDGTQIHTLLYTRHGRAYMLENLRMDGKAIAKLPDSREFTIEVLSR